MTQKEKTFCEEYVKCYNATQAYYNAYDCTMKTAQGFSYRLLRKPEIIAYIKELQQALVERYADAASVILAELMDDITFRDEEGNHSSTWLKSVDLAQKQLGIQKLKADIQAEHTVINVNVEE